MGQVAEPVSRRAKAAKTQVAIVYGKKADDVSMAATSRHCKEIAPAIAELVSLEKTIQQLYCNTLKCGSDVVVKSMAAPAATSNFTPPARSGPTGPPLVAEAAAKRMAAAKDTPSGAKNEVQEDDDK